MCGIYFKGLCVPVTGKVTMRSAVVAAFVVSALVLLLAARYFPFSHQKLGRQNQKQGQEQQQEKKKQQAKETEEIQHQQDQLQHLIYKKQPKAKEMQHLQNIQRQMEIQNLIEFFKRKQQQRHLDKEEEEQKQQMTEQENQTLDAIHDSKRAAREHFSGRLKRLQQFCQSPRNESL